MTTITKRERKSIGRYLVFGTVGSLLGPLGTVAGCAIAGVLDKKDSTPSARKEELQELAPLEKFALFNYDADKDELLDELGSWDDPTSLPSICQSVISNTTTEQRSQLIFALRYGKDDYRFFTVQEIVELSNG